jgi:quercetin dioxygenase-like cupin family protein
VKAYVPMYLCGSKNGTKKRTCLMNPSIMNLADIAFNAQKPSVVSIRKTGKVNIFIVGLLQNQVLPHHKTEIPALLVVLKGAILFRMNGEQLKLVALDSYQIPTDVEHEVIGISPENIFLITQEK